MSFRTLGKLTLVASGTPQPFTVTPTNCRQFFIQALTANTGVVYIGNSALVKATLVGCFRTISAPTTPSTATVPDPAWDVSTDLAGPYDLSTFFWDGDHTGDAILVSFVT